MIWNILLLTRTSMEAIRLILRVSDYTTVSRCRWLTNTLSVHGIPFTAENTHSVYATWSRDCNTYWSGVAPKPACNPIGIRQLGMHQRDMRTYGESISRIPGDGEVGTLVTEHNSVVTGKRARCDLISTQSGLFVDTN